MKRSRYFPFARSIRHLRERAGLTQPELAKELSKYFGVEVTRSAVSMWELASRTPKLYEAAMIAEYFDVSMDALLGTKREATEADRFLWEVFEL